MLGSSGMLGSQVLLTLQRERLRVSGISRSSHPGTFSSESEFLKWAESSELSSKDIVVNCIGWIPQKASGDEKSDAQNAEFANVAVPRALERSSSKLGFQVIQIATDCVFTGKESNRVESTPRYASDMYGLTKIRGEDASPSAMSVRTSIVGLSESNGRSLLDWLVSHPIGSLVSGYTDHLWNGVTTLAFSRLVLGVARERAFESGKFHWVPSDYMSKFDLLMTAARLAGRKDLNITPVSSRNPRDMRLSTESHDLNEKLWNLAGFAGPKTIESLLTDYFLEIGTN